MLKLKKTRFLLILIPFTCAFLIAEDYASSLYLEDDTFDYEKILADTEPSISLQKFLIDEVCRPKEVKVLSKKEEGISIEPTVRSFIHFDTDAETEITPIAENNLKHLQMQKDLEAPEMAEPIEPEPIITEKTPPESLPPLEPEPLPSPSDTIVLDLDDDDEDLDTDMLPSGPLRQETPAEPLMPSELPSSPPLLPIPSAEETLNAKNTSGATHLEQFEEREEEAATEAIQQEAISPSPLPDNSDSIQDYYNPYNAIDMPKNTPIAPYYMEPMNNGPLTAAGSENAPSQVADVESVACTSINVKSFKIVGACSLSTRYLESLVECYGNQTLTLGELEDVAYVITNAYQCCGFPLTKAYILEQDVTDGCIEITVVEPTFDRIFIERFGCTRLCNEAIKRYLGYARVRAPIDQNELEYALLLMNDLPGVTAAFTLKPGLEPRTTSLLVQLREKPLFSGSLETNNYGNIYTGLYQFGLRVNVNDLFGVGDILSGQALYTGKYLQSGRLALTVPVDSHGTKVGVSAAYTVYTLGSIFNVLNATGTAGIYSAFVTTPLYLSQNLSVYEYADIDYRQIKDQLQTISSTTNKEMEVITVGLKGNSVDGWCGMNAFNFGCTLGNLNFPHEAGALDPYVYGTKGGFGKFSLIATRLQRLTNNWSLYGAFTGQLATRNLDGSEQLYLGGPYAVRAYPTGESPGDNVYIGTLEVRYGYKVCRVWLDEAVIKGFIDAGSSLNIKQNIEIPQIPKSRNVAGAGLGIDFIKNDYGVINLCWAHKIAGTPAQSNGKNSTQQFWARVEVQF